MNIQEIESSAGAASELLRALANEHRLVILCQLVDGEKSVGTLAANAGLSQSAVSQHLGRLRAEGLVVTRREAQTIYYALGDDRARGILDALYQIYCAPGAKHKVAGEESTATRKEPQQ